MIRFTAVDRVFSLTLELDATDMFVYPLLDDEECELKDELLKGLGMTTLPLSVATCHVTDQCCYMNVSSAISEVLFPALQG
jgi:hypothetical protein